jgi:hypothetical protein
MAKFLSYDGVDKNGIRAEVMVQTGTGKIKELVPRGRAAKDGTYRNVEVVFTPDNPKLIRKVYALLDTTSKELWEYVQEAHKNEKDISYRIESQRKRTVERTTKFDDLTHSEDVVRILAGIDNIFSHEAKTNPVEDETNDAPSALQQDINNHSVSNSTPAAGSVVSASRILNELANARKLNLSNTIIDMLVASAVSAGASLDEALSAGIDNESVTDMSARNIVGRAFAIEEKPWTAYNSDGRINPGSYMVAHAAAAERFALDHLVSVYSEGKKSPVDVTEEMISQAAALALVLLELSDKVQSSIVGRIDRQKNSYNRAMALVLDAVDKRYLAPIGGNSEAQETWRNSVVGESVERFRGVLAVAEGRMPTADEVVVTDAETIIGNPETPAPEKKANGAKALQETLGAVEKVSPKTSFKIAGDNLIPGAEGFEEPDQDTIAKLKALCVSAGVANDTTAISNWMESAVGARISRRVHKPILESMITHYASLSQTELAEEILSHK